MGLTAVPKGQPGFPRTHGDRPSLSVGFPPSGVWVKRTDAGAARVGREGFEDYTLILSNHRRHNSLYRGLVQAVIALSEMSDHSCLRADSLTSTANIFRKASGPSSHTAIRSSCSR